jgi:3-hydroxyacyl-CoA dehydrogenase
MSADTTSPRPVAVIGGGLIGRSWAALFAASGGHDVRVWDPDEAVRAGFGARVEPLRSQLEALRPDRGGTITVADTLAAAVAGASWIQENAPESVPVKVALYREIEKAALPDTTVATSTSALLWSDLAPGFADPSRLVVAHPFNPPHLVPLVELYGIDAARLDAADAFYRELGQVPVRMKREAVGHIANRLASALYREAVNLVAEGIADVEDVDAALVNGPGLRWSVVGAHMAYHLGGGEGGIAGYLRHLGPSQERRWATLGQPQLTPDICREIIAGVERESAGRSIAQLERERDRLLIATLQAHAAIRETPP